MKEKRIHQSRVWALMQKKDLHGKYAPFGFSYVSLRTGELKHHPKAYFSSIHAKGSTINIRIGIERFPKTFRRCLIVKFNGMKLYA